MCTTAGLGRYAANVPISVLAAILLKSGLDVMDFGYLKRLPNLPATSVIVMVCTTVCRCPALVMQYAADDKSMQFEILGSAAALASCRMHYDLPQLIQGFGLANSRLPINGLTLHKLSTSWQLRLAVCLSLDAN